MLNLKSPPRLAAFLFRLMFPDEGSFTTLGDLEEVFQMMYEEEGAFRAKVWYWLQLITAIPHFIHNYFYWKIIMIHNYLKVAVRNFTKQKTYHFINIFSLSVGLAFCILSFLFIRNEWTYDAFHSQKDNIYRVIHLSKEAQGLFKGRAITSIPLGPTLVQEFPEILQFTRFCSWEFLVNTESQAYTERVLLADETIFEMFNFPVRLGNSSKPFQNQNSIILSCEIAEKYFSQTNPIGQRMSVKFRNHVYDFTVSAVIEKIPENSTIKFDILLPFSNMTKDPGIQMDNWYPLTDVTTYVQLNPQSSSSELEAKFPIFTEKYLYFPYSLFLRDSSNMALQPLTKIHLETEIYGPKNETFGNPTYSWILFGISLVVLLMACINFINLSVGQSFRRVSEVGVRKVVGATRIQLMKQFWGETILLGIFSLLFGILLAELFLPAFNRLTQTNLTLDYVENISTLIFLTGLITFVALVAGVYPALLISGFHPAEVLKSRLKIKNTGIFNRALVIFQFAIAITLIISMVEMQLQTKFLSQKDLGFNPEQVLIISIKNLKDQSLNFYHRFKNELEQEERIIKVSAFDDFLDHTMGGGTIKNARGDEVEFDGYYVDYDLFETLEMKLVEGRNFSKLHPADVRKSCIVSETLAGSMGWDSPCGQMLSFQLSAAKYNVETKELMIVENLSVIGVIKDYHFKSLHHKLRPIALFLNPLSERQIAVRISSGDIPGTIAMLSEKWQTAAPNTPFEWRFLDDAIQQQYQSEQRWTRIITYASLFAIFIACLGLVGLSMHAASRRTREISIRKVLGASVSGIVKLLSGEFVFLVITANLLAWPTAWFAMNKWLENFAYHVNIEWWIFVVTGIFAISAALVSVSFQAMKAARGKSLYLLQGE